MLEEYERLSDGRAGKLSFRFTNTALKPFFNIILFRKKDDKFNQVDDAGHVSNMCFCSYWYNLLNKMVIWEKLALHTVA